MKEQQEIIKEVDRLWSLTTGIETVIDAEIIRSERLRQSILKKAFSGRLVPQNPNATPASKLLERIQSA